MSEPWTVYQYDEKLIAVMEENETLRSTLTDVVRRVETMNDDAALRLALSIVLDCRCAPALTGSESDG